LFGVVTYLIGFGLGLSSGPWVVNAEIYPTRLRGLGQASACTANWAANYVVAACVEIKPVRRVYRQFFTKSFLGDDAAVLAPSSGEGPASPRHRADVASMAWRSTRRFSANAP
jgi:hypothetical protein